MRILVDEYEVTGDGVLRILAQEDRVELLREMADRGRAAHQEWLAESFPGTHAGLRGAARERRIAQLHALTDVYTWKLLRRDLGLTRNATATALQELLEPMTITKERH